MVRGAFAADCQLFSRVFQSVDTAMLLAQVPVGFALPAQRMDKKQTKT
jgi:hypothetical protein